MRHASLPLAAALAALAGCGQPVFSAQVEIPEVRIVQAPQDFPPTSLDPSTACSFIAPLPPSCVAAGTSYDIGAEVPMLKEKGVKVDLRLTDVALHLATGAASDLRGVTRAEVDLRDPATGGFTRVASYVRPSPTAAPTTIDVTGQASLDLAPYLSGGRLDARIAVEVDPLYLPSGFSAAMEAGFSLSVTVDYSAFL
jgi:ABC-type amino acid transport substrate-binding protein